jgi:CubicO group peptidase (beta-lactamase class C family)
MKLKIVSISIFLCLLLSCTSGQKPKMASEFYEGKPRGAGLIKERLTRIDDRIQKSIDQGEVAGTVALIARDGIIGYHKAFGQADIANNKPMERSSLFRIASMSKLMTVVGALILFEKGHFGMDTNLKDILPEFEDPVVMVDWDEAKKEFVTEKALNPIKMKHLFSHTSGLVYPIFTSKGREGFLAAKVQDGFPKMDITLEEDIKRLATLPLAHEPGEKWTYGMNMDVLGRIIEVIDGRPFARFMEEELFGPLGLEDTGFEVAEEDWDRVVQVYTTIEDQLQIFTQEVSSRNAPNSGLRWWKGDSEKIALGGAGVVTTAYDYARFLQMLLNDGELDGVRILGRKTVELLRRPLFEDFSDESTSMGLSVWVLEEEELAYTPASIGSYGWGGYFYTSYWIDPEEKLVAVIMNQVSPTNSSLNSDFVALTYAALQ